MGNPQRLCANEGSKHQVLQRLQVCHICHGGEGEDSHECKATQGGWKSHGTKEGCLKRRLQRPGAHLTVKKSFIGGIKEDMKNIT